MEFDFPSAPDLWLGAKRLGDKDSRVPANYKLEKNFGAMYRYLTESLYPELLSWDPASCITRMDELKAWNRADEDGLKNSAPTEQLTDEERIEMEIFDITEDTYLALDARPFPPAEKFFQFDEEPIKWKERIEHELTHTVSRLIAIHKRNVAVLEGAFHKDIRTLPPVEVKLLAGNPYLGAGLSPKPMILASTSFLRNLIKMTSRVLTESNSNSWNYLNAAYYFFILQYRYINVNTKKLEEWAGQGDEFANDFLNLRMLNEIVFGRALRFVLLHEIGHFAFGHHFKTKQNCQSFKDNELEADHYAALMSKLIIGNDDAPDDPLLLLRLDRTGYTSFFAVAFRLAGFRDNPNEECRYPGLRERLAVADQAWEYGRKVVGET